MFRVLMLLALVGALVMAASPGVAGTGTVRLSWDNCDPVVLNKDWTGNIQYKLVMSITGSDLQNDGHRTKVRVGPNLEDAWRFDSAGCNTGQLTVSHNALNKACLAFQGGSPLGLNDYLYDAGEGWATLDITNTYDPFTPDPALRYTLWQATFDHAFSDTGMQDPALACGFADNPVCFVIVTVPDTEWELLVTGQAKQPFEGFDNGWVSWQDAGNSLPCPGVQAKEATWGRVKGLYR